MPIAAKPFGWHEQFDWGVFDGGWAKEEDERLEYAVRRREWMIVTAGACVSIFSRHEPEVREPAWPAGA